MSTEFKTVENVKEYIAYSCKIKVEDLKEDNEYIIKKMGEILDPSLEKDKSSHKSFVFKNHEGKEVRIVVSPFRSGFDCWVVGDNGWAVRI